MEKLASNNSGIKSPNFRLLGDRVALIPDPKKKITESGIVIPDTHEERLMTGQVVAVGPGKKDMPAMFMKIGDKVIFNKDAGIDIEFEGQDLRIIRGIDIYSVL